MRIAQEEIFGPVLSVIPFKDEEDAVRLANATDFGLLAGIWTSDASRLTRMAKRMHCGQVYLNCYGAGGGVDFDRSIVTRDRHHLGWAERADADNHSACCDSAADAGGADRGKLHGTIRLPHHGDAPHR